MIRNRLPNVIRDVNECRFAYHNASQTMHAVISDLHISFPNILRQVSVFFAAPVITPSTDNYHFLKSVKENPKTKRFFVCGNTGCWSTKNILKERIQAFKINRQIRQFITELSPDDQNNGSKTELADILDKVFIHMQYNGSHTDVEGKENT